VPTWTGGPAPQEIESTKKPSQIEVEAITFIDAFGVEVKKKSAPLGGITQDRLGGNTLWKGLAKIASQALRHSQRNAEQTPRKRRARGGRERLGERTGY